jgi:dolichol-phosphate mannosyltransferase
MSKKKLSCVVSVFNEEQSLENFYNTTVPILDSCTWDYELIFVNDGSTDKSVELLESFAERNSKVIVIDFARNFGHEAAMIAGIDYATGDGIICMDADLQHPPIKIPEIIQKFDEGYEVVSMIRTKNEGAGLLKRITSTAFYKILNLISPVKFENNSSDFFAIAKPVAEVLRKDYREKVRYLRGYVQSVGFRKTTIEFEAKDREAGKSKYSLKKLADFSINAMCSFSDFPLKLGIYSGMLVGILGLILMIYTIINKAINGAPAGYSTIIVALCFLFAVTLFVIGIIGEYIAILFNEIKDRPIYIVRKTISKEYLLEAEEETKG